jgi:hypothetical protein
VSSTTSNNPDFEELDNDSKAVESKSRHKAREVRVTAGGARTATVPALAERTKSRVDEEQKPFSRNHHTKQEG